MLGRDGRFALSHRHSVAKLPWVDEFRVGSGNELVLYRTRYGAFGAGLPSGDEGGTVSLEDGWIVIDGMDRRFASVVLAPSGLHRAPARHRQPGLGPVAARGRAHAGDHGRGARPRSGWSWPGGWRTRAACAGRRPPAGPEPTMDGEEGGGS